MKRISPVWHESLGKICANFISMRGRNPYSVSSFRIISGLNQRKQVMGSSAISHKGHETKLGSGLTVKQGN